ncbi:MAG: tetratricopeptide repeat protein [Candidatus Wallbacteria bacterium]|nr:tetratricopeptide repeat protein [Candidatus Wallbacteria bacterium]
MTASNESQQPTPPDPATPSPAPDGPRRSEAGRRALPAEPVGPPRFWSALLTAGFLELAILAAVTLPGLQASAAFEPPAARLARFLPLLFFCIIAAALLSELLAVRHLRRGLAAWSRGDDEEAEAHFRRATARAQGLNGLHHLALGCALHRRGELADAVGHYRSALRSRLGGPVPASDATARACAANLRAALEEGPVPAAPSSAGRLHGPLVFLIYITIAVTMERMLAPWIPDRIGFLLLALLACAAAARGTLSRVRLARGRYLLELGDASGACEDFRESIRLWPRQVQAHVALGAAHEACGNAGAARAQYQEALALCPNSAEASERLAALMEAVNPSVPAARSLPQEWVVPPRGPMPPSRDSSVLAAIAVVATSIVALSVLQPGAATLAAREGWTMPIGLALGAWLVSVCLLLASASFQRLVRTGIRLQEAGDTTGAIRCYEAAGRAAPMLAGSLTRYNLGTAYHQDGDLPGAIREYRQVISAAFGAEEWLPSAENNLALAIEQLPAGATAASLGFGQDRSVMAGGVLPLLLGTGWAAGLHVLWPQLGCWPALAAGAIAAWLVVRVGAPARKAAAARWFLNAGDHEAAALLSRQALALSTRSAELHYLLACAHQEAGLDREAATELREALRLDPGHTAAARSLALHEPDTAERLARPAGPAPSLAEPRRSLRGPMRAGAGALAGCGLFAATAGLVSVSMLWQMTQPGGASAGQLLLFLYSASIACLFAADFQTYVHLRRALALEAGGNGREAGVEYRRAIRQAVGSVPLMTARYNLGLRFHDQGDLRSAVLQYREALRSAPGAAARLDVRHNLARGLLELESVRGLRRSGGRSRVRSEGSVRRPPAEAVLFAWMVPIGAAFSHAAAGAALGTPVSLLLGAGLGAAWVRASRLRRHVQAGLELLDVGDAQGAIEELTLAARISPSNASTRAHLGRALEAAGELHAAVREYEESLALEPVQPALRERLTAVADAAGV